MENDKPLKTGNKILYHVCALIGGISFVLFFLFISVYCVVFNRTIFHNSMVREYAADLNSHELSQEQLDYVIDDVLKYLNDGRELMDTSIEGYEGELFTETEISHMVDVKALFTGVKILTIISGISAPAMLFFMYFLDKDHFKRRHKLFFIFTAAGTAVFLTALGVMMMINFDATFVLFHELLFTNLDWQLSGSDLLIEMLPSTLFLRLGIYICVSFAAFMALFLTFGLTGGKITGAVKRNREKTGRKKPGQDLAG